MTIKVKQYSIDDLTKFYFVNEDTPSASINKLHKLGAVDFEAEKALAMDKLEDLTMACTTQMMSFLKENYPGHHLWLFLAHYGWQSDSRVIRYKKLWNSSENYKLLSKSSSQYNEFLHESPEGLKYYGLLQLNEEIVFKAVEMVRMGNRNDCFIVASKRRNINSQRSAQKMYSLTLPENIRDTRRKPLEWLKSAYYLASKGDLYIRVLGILDDPSVDIQVIFRNREA